MGLKSIKERAISNSGRGGEKVYLSSALNEEGKLGSAYKLIMENKKLRKSFTKTLQRKKRSYSIWQKRAY